MSRIAQEEIFGPVLSVIPVDGYDEAMAALNHVTVRPVGRRSSRGT